MGRDPQLDPGIDTDLTVTASVFRVNRAADFTRFATFTMDELALYDRVLAPEEVTEHWAAYRDNAGDSDGDGVTDPRDNCTLVANADQRDTNGDDYGNICDADVSNNLETNFGDLAVFKSAFFPRPYDPDSDFNGDDAVNFGDLAKIKELFLQPPGPSGTAFLCDY